MNPEMIKTIGKWVVIPVCAVALIMFVATLQPQVIGWVLLLIFAIFLILLGSV